MKVNRGAADLLAARAQREGRPTTVTFQITDRCNYECVHCYQEHETHDNELTTAEVLRILDELADAGVLFLTFMGGEVFMRRDADEILAAAHARGFALRLLTTGHHITDKRADFLATLRPLQPRCRSTPVTRAATRPSPARPGRGSEPSPPRAA